MRSLILNQADRLHSCPPFFGFLNLGKSRHLPGPPFHHLCNGNGNPHAGVLGGQEGGPYLKCLWNGAQQRLFQGIPKDRALGGRN